MKKLGLIGGTGPESTLIYYKDLNTKVNRIMEGQAFPEIAIESVNMYKALGYVKREEYDQLTDYLLGKIRNLEAGGAEVIALTAATMHIVFDALKDQVKVPFIGIPDAAAAYSKAQGYKKVGLLGTIFTMENDYLSGSFEKIGVKVIVPNKEDRELVNEHIANELEYGIVKEESVQDLLDVIDKMQSEEGIDAVILGCTELPLALGKDNMKIPFVDIMQTHIETLVKLITE